MTGTANWKGFNALRATPDIYCCAVQYFYSLYPGDANYVITDKDAYSTFLAEQLKKKLGTGNYIPVTFAHVPNNYPKYVHDAFLKAGFILPKWGDDNHNAFWNPTHGPSAIITYAWFPKDGTTIAAGGDSKRAYKSPIPPALLPKAPSVEPVAEKTPTFMDNPVVKVVLKKRVAAPRKKKAA